MSLNLQGVHFLWRDGSIFSFPYPFFLGIFAGRSHAVDVPEQSLFYQNGIVVKEGKNGKNLDPHHSP